MYKNYINRLKEKYVGKKVMHEGEIYNIVDVDYNGILHIDRPTPFTETTAVFESYEADKAIIN